MTAKNKGRRTIAEGKAAGVVSVSQWTTTCHGRHGKPGQSRWNGLKSAHVAASQSDLDTRRSFHCLWSLVPACIKVVSSREIEYMPHTSEWSQHPRGNKSTSATSQPMKPPTVKLKTLIKPSEECSLISTMNVR